MASIGLVYAGRPVVLHTRLVVAADGANSVMRKMADLRVVSLDYGQRGVVATVSSDKHATAWQRFLPTGPLALLPIRCALSLLHQFIGRQHSEVSSRYMHDAMDILASCQIPCCHLIFRRQDDPEGASVLNMAQYFSC
jgi:2-polyprenyl-6-methoxyphenol hydroxylase-like FAD-dependent oxidoreductase